MSNLLSFKLKSLVGVAIVATIIVAALAFATTASAAYMHTTTLKQGMSGSQVTSLQATLGVTPMSGYFGTITKAAVMAFQSSNGLVADGVVGPMTGAALGGVASSGGSYPAGCTSSSGYSTTTGALCSGGGSYPAGCTSASGYSPTTGVKCDGSTTTTTGGGATSSGPLAGGAGSITVTAVSTYSGEEVGEDEEDAEIMAFEVEADEDSDVDVTSVKVEFVESGATSSEDLNDYVDSVSIWLNGDEVGSADADSFTENSDVFTKTISLDGAIVRAGDTEEFVIAVTSQPSLDSGDIDSDAWSVDALNVRFEDGEGVVTTEDTDGDTLDKTFDFASFADAVNAELQVALNDDDTAINEAHVINVHSSDDTDDETILSFTLEAEGDSDILLKELPVLVTVTGAANVDDMINNITLWRAGEQVAAESVGSGVGATETYTFDDLDELIGAGDTEEFMVKVDLKSTADVDLDVGDTIMADLTGTEVDLIEAEDESGEDLAAADLTGTADGEASEVRDVGMIVEFVSSSAVVSHAGDIANTNDHDRGTFTIVFDVTAFDGDVFIDETAPIEAGGSGEADLTITGTDTYVTSSITSSDADDVTNSFRVDEDETNRFTISVVLEGGADGLFKVELADLVYALTDIDANLAYTFNLDEFETPELFLNLDS